MIQLAVYFFISRLLIWALQTTPLAEPFRKKFKIVNELFSCDFCLGCWVCLATALIFQIDFFGAALAPLFSFPLTALLSSFLLHIFVLGLITKWGITVISSNGD